jgi:hypothetical protein
LNVPAAAGAEKVICCAVPGESANDVCEEFIPFGNPLTVMFTVPENPFTAFSETVTGKVVPPTWVETEAGETTTLKSAGVGTCGCAEEDAHPLRTHRPMMEINNRR